MAQGMFRGGLSGAAVRVCTGLIAVVLLGGCTASPDDVDPTATTLPPTRTAEPTPEPAEEPPEEPVAPLPRNGTPDERDAEAAGEFFMRLYEYTLRTGDTEQWVERSLPGCDFCTNVADDVNTYTAQGAKYVGVELELEPAQFVDFEEALRMFAVEVPYETPDVEVVGADGGVLKAYKGGPAFLLVEMAYEPSTGWLLRTGIGREESLL